MDEVVNKKGILRDNGVVICNICARIDNENIDGILKWMVKSNRKDKLSFTNYHGIDTS